MDDVGVATIMTKEFATVSPDCAIPQLLEVMRESGGGCAIVCEEGIPTGVITMGDLLPVLVQALRGDETGDLTAIDVMSFPPFALTESELTSDVMALVQQRGFSSVPVVNDRGELVGLVRAIHLLAVYSEQLDAERATLEQLVAERTGELLDANERLQQISFEDALMQIGNRRAMNERLNEIHETTRKTGSPYSVVMLDLDCFKNYNDMCGHLEGDAVLQEVVAAIRDALRQNDALYRYGGEEILALLPLTGIEGACEAAERIRRSIEAREIPHPGSPHPVVTVSGGVATSIGSQGIADHWSHVISSADEALYRAKKDGRNRIST